MDADQIVTALKQVMDAVQTLEQASTQTSTKVVDEKNILLAKQYPIKGHYLVDETEIVREYYIGFLLAFCNNISNRLLEQSRMYYICRIIASYDSNVNLEKYVAQSLKVDTKTIYHLVQVFDSDAATYFSVDLLILSMMDESGIRKRGYEAISDFFQFLRMSKSDVRKAAKIAKSIIEQDFNSFLGNINATDTTNYNYFLGYFSDNEYTAIVNSIADIQRLKGSVLVVNAQISNYQEYFELSECIADSITFRNCSFVNIKGFRGNKQKVVFDGCRFENNYFDVSESKRPFSGFLGKGPEGEKEAYVFIQGNGIVIKNTTFSDICVSKSILDIAEGEIRECKFINCKGIELPCSYLFQLDNGKIANSTFDNCTMVTSRDNRSSTIGGILAITNGYVKDCEFDKCSAGGESGYGSYAEFKMQIVRAKNTKVEKNVFNDCHCTSDNSSNKRVKSYILGLKNSSENENEFVDCYSYHYNYGDILGSHNTGEIE